MRKMPEITVELRGPGQVEAAKAAAEAVFELICWNAEREHEKQASLYGKDSEQAKAANDAWILAGAQARLAKSQLLQQISRTKAGMF